MPEFLTLSSPCSLPPLCSRCPPCPPPPPGPKLLYLGGASGTSVSHCSDLVGPEGAVYAVEFSHRRSASLFGSEGESLFGSEGESLFFRVGEGGDLSTGGAGGVRGTTCTAVSLVIALNSIGRSAVPPLEK